MVDAGDSKSSAARLASSSLASGTTFFDSSDVDGRFHWLRALFTRYFQLQGFGVSFRFSETLIVLVNAVAGFLPEL
jgi:hypothetical protein